MISWHDLEVMEPPSTMNLAEHNLKRLLQITIVDMRSEGNCLELQTHTQ